MSVELKKVDGPNSTVHLHDKLTNDPVAILHRDKYSKQIYAQWHPDAVEMHPVLKHIANMNLGSADAMSSMVNRVSGHYDRVINKHNAAGLLDTEHAGTETRKVKSQYGSENDKEYDKFHAKNEKGEILGSVLIHRPYTKEVGVNDKVFDYDSTHSLYTLTGDQKPTPEQREMLHKKFATNSPIDNLRRIKYWHELKDKEPSFIGVRKTDNHFQYKTKLSPEEAVSKYSEHLLSQNNNMSTHEVTPRMHVLHDNTYTHIIDGHTRGALHHYKVLRAKEDDYRSQPLSHVID